jgi:putative flippase GtrA
MDGGYGRLIASAGMRTRLLHLLDPLLHRLPPEQRVLLVQFLRFGVIGTAGFVWDTIIVYTLTPRTGVYAAGLISYFIVASLNWGLNRIWTYAHVVHGSRHKQLIMFLIANSAGLVLNRGTYSALVHFVPFCRIYLVVPVAAGGICGMFVNFFLSRRLVFK